MAIIHNKKFVRRWLFSIKNLELELKGSAFDSDQGHLGGLDVGLIKMIKKWILNIHPQIWWSASLGIKNLDKIPTIRIFRIAYYLGNLILGALDVSKIWYLLVIVVFLIP